MAIQVYLTPTTAAPAAAQVEADMRAAIRAEGASVVGQALQTSDGAKVAIGDDLQHFNVETLSPSFCRILYNGAHASNSTVDREGADVTPLKMRGSPGHTPYVRMRTDTMGDAADLCARLQADLDDWNAYVRKGQASGFLGADGRPLAPPSSPGSELRLQSDPSGIVAFCKSSLGRLHERIVREVTTQNPQFGVVWRADVSSPPYPKILTRFLCWQGPGAGTDRGVEIAELPLEMFDPKQSIAPLQDDASTNTTTPAQTSAKPGLAN